MGAGNIIAVILAGVIGVAVGSVVATFIQRSLSNSHLKLAKMQVSQMTEEAETKAKSIRVEAEEQAIQIRNEADQESKKTDSRITRGGRAPPKTARKPGQGHRQA